MSLSPWEQHALDSIRDGLVGSDPELATLMTTFARLASGEEMPAREPVQARKGRPPRRGKRPPHRGKVRRRAHQVYYRLGFHRVALLLWLVITVALITTAVALDRNSQDGCTDLWVPVSAAAHPACPVNGTGAQTGPPSVR